MVRFRRNVLMAETPFTLDENENSIEYSFALEYPGLAINFSIPRAIPVDIDEIPTATLVVSDSEFNSFLLPIIQPIGKKSRRVLRRRAESIVSSSSVTPEADLYSPDSSKIDLPAKLSDEIESSSTLEICDQKLEGGIELDEDENDKSFESYMVRTNWESANSVFSSSEIFSSKEEEEIENKKPSSMVTFRDPESDEVISEEESSQYETESIQVRPKAERKGKRGSCYRCLKGNRLTEKETCIVCGAKYCCDCVLREMGSMPEGRKCVGCIGFRIDESRRESLGKCSRMLKRMLSRMEIGFIMRAEMESLINQLPGKLVCVNDELITQEELGTLQKCSNPPKRLKPGSYWYDKVSGLWGEKGKEPCQIISPDLNVGGHMKRDASNGNTNVLVNNREITKKELYMLKMAGVTCEGSPSFWVHADGSYLEEGMNNVKGNIWNKGKMKMVCAVLSLPLPPNPTKSRAEEPNRVVPNSVEQSIVYKLLLVGYNNSGTITIFKQAKSLYNVPFSENERRDIKAVIQRNLYGYIGILLEGRQRFEEETLFDKSKMLRCDQLDPSDSVESAAGKIGERTTYEIGRRLKAFSDWLLNVMVSGNLDAIFPAVTREYAAYVEDLWKDPAFQVTYTRRNELELLPRIATYFLDRAMEISKMHYEPSADDILYAEGITASNGLSSMEFSFPESPRDVVLDQIYQHDPSQIYQLIRVHPSSLGKKCKWVEMFENVDVVLFCAALTDYDEFDDNIFGDSINKMIATKKLFESLIQNVALKNKQFLLLLNKFDLFEERIKQVPLSRCEWFDDFNPLINSNFKVNGSNGTNTSLAHQGFQYIAVKFKRLFSSHTNNKLFVFLTTGMEADSVNEALRYAREILKWRKDKPAFVSELSSMSIDASSSS